MSRSSFSDQVPAELKPAASFSCVEVTRGLASVDKLMHSSSDKISLSTARRNGNRIQWYRCAHRPAKFVVKI